ncbi:hypothetical protein [Azohydromonas sediminis]|uniref:hypothetical protein n=1 Tax=Azohydromonas sediminis TaxID=2259674 RepID=UPI0013C36057|nr:hypothetical protein [Azohydromonas sediminis]
MSAETLIWATSAAVGSGLLAGMGVGVWARRRITLLRTQIEHGEAARTAAVERSRQARQQIAQLQEELAAAKAELGKRKSEQSRRDEVARRLDEEPTMVLPRHELPSNGFADTMPLA